MSENITDIDQIIAKQLAGEISPEESSMLKNWLDDSTENQRYFADLQWLWQKSPQARPESEQAVDTEAALQKVKMRLQNRQRTGGARIVPFRQWWMAAAAAFVAILAALFWLRPKSAELPHVEIAARDTVFNSRLADGSTVALNRLSSLSSVGQFNKHERRVRLQGEAFFEVKPDTTRPFVVEIDEKFEVKVVGTAFNVDNQSDAGRVSVTVSEGKVRLTSKAGTTLLLAGEAAICDLASGKIERQQTPDPNFLAYKNRVFHFDATPLSRVVEQLAKAYGAEISLKNKSLQNCPLSADYKNLPLDRVLDLIAESFSLKIEKSGEAIILTGEGCN